MNKEWRSGFLSRGEGNLVDELIWLACLTACLGSAATLTRALRQMSGNPCSQSLEEAGNHGRGRTAIQDLERLWWVGHLDLTHLPVKGPASAPSNADSEYAGPGESLEEFRPFLCGWVGRVTLEPADNKEDKEGF